MNIVYSCVDNRYLKEYYRETILKLDIVKIITILLRTINNRLMSCLNYTTSRSPPEYLNIPCIL